MQLEPAQEYPLRRLFWRREVMESGGARLVEILRVDNQGPSPKHTKGNGKSAGHS